MRVTTENKALQGETNSVLTEGCAVLGDSGQTLGCCMHLKHGQARPADSQQLRPTQQDAGELPWQDVANAVLLSGSSRQPL